MNRGEGVDFFDFLIFVAVLSLVVLACAAWQS
jgi:hypothetical protein